MFSESPAKFIELCEVLDEHCATVGRNPNEILRSMHIGWAVEDDPKQLADQLEPLANAINATQA